MCVLLVEDEPIIREIMAESLEDAGFEVVQAETGDEAARLIQSPVKPFGVLVTDLHMPGHRDGLMVAALLRERQPGVPVVIATGRPDVVQASWERENGYRLLRKPYMPSELVTLVSKLMDEP